MFGIGPMEMVVVAVVALMLFSPRELPKMLRSVAKFWGQLRATADEFKETIMTADGVNEIQELVKGTKGQIRQVETDARRELMKARAEMRKAQQKLLKANQAKQEIRQREKGEETDAAAGDGTKAGAGAGDGTGEDSHADVSSSDADDPAPAFKPVHPPLTGPLGAEAAGDHDYGSHEHHGDPDHHASEPDDAPHDGPVASEAPHQVARRAAVPPPPTTSSPTSSPPISSPPIASPPKPTNSDDTSGSKDAGSKNNQGAA